MAESDKTYSQAEFDAMVAERDALKGNRDTILKEAKDAKAALKAFDGVDPAEFLRLKEAAEEADKKKAAAEGDFRSLEKQLIDRHAAEKKQLLDQHANETKGRDDKISKLASAMEKRAVRAELQAALVKAGAKKGSMDLLVEHGARYGRVRETDDDFEGYVADEKGNPMIADGKGTPMTFELFAETTLKTKFPDLFDGSGSSGGGASKSGAGGGGGGARNIASTNSPDFLANLDTVAAGKTTVGS